MALSRASCAVSTQETYRRWISYLRRTRTSARNSEALLEYFWRMMRNNSGNCAEFLQFFEESLRTDTSVHLAQQYLTVLSPLLERLSLFVEKNRLDDLCFSLVYPAEYEHIEKIFLAYKKKSVKTIRAVTRVLERILKDMHLNYEVSGRYKSFSSVYRKFQKRPLKHYLDLNDIFAFRIVLDAHEDVCFRVLNMMHDLFRPVPDFFRDYITVPKINGYQSLHTGVTHVLPDLDLAAEIQIRTRTMHDFAEHGRAAHWLYAEKKESQLVRRDELRWTRKFGEDASCERVAFFSYEGDFFELPAKSTVRDFASFLHTKLANSARGARINGVISSVDTEISEGDMIEISTS